MSAEPMTRILLVDDEPDWRDTLRAVLVEEGYVVVVADDGYEALAAVGNEPPDLILMDLTMPGMDGFETTMRLKNDFATQHIPIIILTARQELQDKLAGLDTGADDYVMKPFEVPELLARIRIALQRSERILHANPLTRLPGNLTVSSRIDKLIEDGTPFAVCYADIDNFKAFNDCYGYGKGDEVIAQTAHVLRHAVRRHGGPDDMVGHIGGDDFVVITTPERQDAICGESTSEFDRLIPLHYSDADRERGAIIVRSRRGDLEAYPLMTLSIAVVSDARRAIRSSALVSGIAAELKRYLKPLPGSNYLADRRIGPAGDERATWETTSAPDERGGPAEVMPPLGQLLVAEGVIREAQLEKALQQQWKTGRRLGDILVSQGAAEPGQIGRALSKRLGVPYVPLTPEMLDEGAVCALPLSFIRLHRVLPLYLEKGELCLAMPDPLNGNLVREAEELAGRAVRPLLCVEAEFEKVLPQALRIATG